MTIFSFSMYKKAALLLSAVLFSTITFAQQATPVGESHPDITNSLMQIFLLFMVGILGFVIWGMGQVIVLLSKQLIKKQKSEASKTVSVLLLIVGFGLLSQIANAQTTIAETPSSFGIGGINGIAAYTFIAAIAVEVFAIFYMAGIIRNLHKSLFDINEVPETQTSSALAWWHDLDKKIFTKAVPVEKEADVLLDHDYDGIRELDNALPPWWKYGFYITIVVAFVYIFLFHVIHTGKNPTEEYAAQMEEARVQKEKFEATNKDKVDEASVPMADAAGLDRGKQIFVTDCFPCHGKLGEGGAGPNLTDDYWLHKGSLNDIYHTIKNGYPDKGMQAWIVKYNEKQISEIASYVKTLHGTNPPGAKAPQGDLFMEGNDSSTVKKDSTVLSVVKK